MDEFQAPLVRKYFDKIQTKDEIIAEGLSKLSENDKNCNHCSFSYEGYKPEYRELFKKRIIHANKKSMI